MNIGGKERPIAFTINALLELKEVHKIDVLNGFDKDSISLEGIRAIALVGLKHGAKRDGEKFEETAETVGDWLDIQTIGKLFQQLTGQSVVEGASGEGKSLGAS